MFHISKHCVCLQSTFESAIESKFRKKYDFTIHGLSDEFYMNQNFEEQIEHSNYKQTCHIMSREFVFQPNDSIITTSCGIKKVDDKFNVWINLMMYHNKKFYTKDSKLFDIPEKYIQYVHESQSDSSKIFFSNFVNEPSEIIDWLNKEMNVDVCQVITNLILSIDII